MVAVFTVIPCIVFYFQICGARLETEDSGQISLQEYTSTKNCSWIIVGTRPGI